MKTKSLNAILYASLTVVAIVNIFPIFWMISSAFKVPTELYTSEIRLIPHQPTLENFWIPLFEYDVSMWFLNSVVTTLGISVFQVVVSLLAAFALSYYTTRFNEAVFYCIIVTMVIPFQVTMVPNYILISRMRLINTWAAVILPSIPAATTFFFLRQHVRSIPRVLFEVARIEGARSPWTLIHVVFGLCKGAISAMFILCVIESWNLYFWPLLVLNKPETRTLPIGLQQFMDHEAGNRVGPFMATATLASLPIIALFICIQRNIIEAFVTAGIKG